MSVRRISSIAHSSNAALVDAAKDVCSRHIEYDRYLTYFPRGRKLGHCAYSSLVVGMVLDDFNSRFVWTEKNGVIELNDTTKNAVPRSEKKDGDEENVNADEKTGPELVQSSSTREINSSHWIRVNVDFDQSQYKDLKIWNGIRDAINIAITPRNIPADLNIDEEQDKEPLNQIWQVEVPPEDDEDDGCVRISILTNHMFYALRKLYSQPIPTERAELESAQKMAQCVLWSASAMLSHFSSFTNTATDSAEASVFRQIVAEKSVLPLDVFKANKVLEEISARPGLGFSTSEADVGLMALQDLTLGVKCLANQYHSRTKKLLSTLK